MCPERALLSPYVDGELDLRKVRRVEAHVAGCDGCRQRLRAYQRVSHALLESHEPDIHAAGDRVWRRLDLVLQAARRQTSFWTRGVQVSAPVAVAAMVGVTLLITSVALWARINDTRSELANLDAAGVSRVAGPAEIEPWPTQGAIVIQLPAESQFLQLGTPAILREAELAQVAGLELAPGDAESR